MRQAIPPASWANYPASGESPQTGFQAPGRHEASAAGASKVKDSRTPSCSGLYAKQKGNLCPLSLHPKKIEGPLKSFFQQALNC
jgi:hypothetical protein